MKRLKSHKGRRALYDKDTFTSSTDKHSSRTLIPCLYILSLSLAKVSRSCYARSISMASRSFQLCENAARWSWSR
ncbi:hypothetical protein N7468_004151 [Penicillium chermesinum]|uniref:Uncharacterized protein n=1 Tax=Penicillium chermesinum TaxID=63820 RepID=A0A9W9PAT9_9EURO|nr:uncharacterized protein N7468_004151 [Penicillium chermesinum]KAJ5239532.1 hypothetical protein N7468_004151 [Penicillium chermesinum]